MAKKCIKSGVTFKENLFLELDKIVQQSKHFKISKSEIINMLLSEQNLNVEEIQKKIIIWRKANE